MFKILKLPEITRLPRLQFSYSPSFFKMTDTIVENRKMYLQMPVAEKRARYSCGNEYTTLDDVPHWTAVFRNIDASLLLEKAAIEKYHNDGFGPFTPNLGLGQKVSMWRGDITTLEIDAIVNAANETLLGGGGVDGAIHRAAGPEMKAECMTLQGCPTGEAKLTGGYRLPAKYVIHTVGPRGENPDKLQQCYQNCLDIVLKEGLRTVAFPCISTGIYGYPQENAAKVALTTVRNFLEKQSDSIDRVIFCLFLQDDIDIYTRLMQIAFPLN